MIHPDEEVAKKLSLEWDQDVKDIGLSQVDNSEDDDFLAGVSACGMSPEECEACT